MKKTLALLLAMVMIVVTACSGGKDKEKMERPAETSSSTMPETSEETKMNVVTTLFPNYDFAKIIGGDKAEVSLLLPPGVEPHSFEPTPKDITIINQSNLFIYTGEAMEPWAEKVVAESQEAGVYVIDASEGIELKEHEHFLGAHDHHDHDHDHDSEEHKDHDHDHDATKEEHHDHDHDAAIDNHEDHNHDSAEHQSHENKDHDHDHDHDHEKDPHIWLDPMLAKQMAENILKGFIVKDGKNAAYYTENCERLKKELDTLHSDIETMLKDMTSKTIIYGGHFAFGYFADRYGLEFISPYQGFSPSAEPTPKDIAELTESLKKSGSKTIFYEELTEPRIAKVISEETGAEMVELHGIHNVSKEEMTSGAGYVEIMRRNMEHLKHGLTNGK